MQRHDDTIEVNFDAIPGPAYFHPSWIPSHSGNLAAQRSPARASNPRQAALESLGKAGTLMRLGVAQACLPPLMRPNFQLLHRLGLLRDRGVGTTTDWKTLARQLGEAAKRSREGLLFAFSPAGTWAANWATVSPSPDTEDHRAHFTPANRTSLLYRSIEAEETCHILRQIFFDPSHFVVHDPLPAAYELSDEGAANHMRLTRRHGSASVNVFVYGRDGYERPDPASEFLPRQTRQACETIARLHRLNPKTTFYVKQHPAAVRAGCFHNDVIAASHRDMLLFHELAFAEPEDVEQVGAAFEQVNGGSRLRAIEVPQSTVPLEDACRSYLFNCQLVGDPEDGLVLLAPRECRQIPAVRGYLQTITGPSRPLRKIQYVDLASSMRNGGGPACLRLRVVLTPAQRRAMSQGIFMDRPLARELERFVTREYPDNVTEAMFEEPAFLERCFAATVGLYALLGLTPALA